MINKTLEEVTAAIEAAVAEKGPGFIYTPPTVRTMCRYVHDTVTEPVPGCLVGNVLHRLGVDLRSIAAQEGNSVEDLDLVRLGLELPPAAVQALQSAQNSQDDWETWGEALEAYYERLDALVVSV